MRTTRNSRIDRAASTSRFQTLLSDASEAALVIRGDTRTIEACNQAAERMFGYAEKELIGSTTERLHTSREAYERFATISERAISQDGVFVSRYTMRRRDGSTFSTRHRVILVETPERDDMVVSFVRDATESGLPRLSELLDAEMAALIVNTRGVEDRWRAVVRRLALEFGWDYGEVWTPRNNRLRLTTWWTPEDSAAMRRFVEVSQSVEFQAGEGLPGRVWRSRGVEWIGDISQTPESVLRRTFSARATGFRTWFAAPALSDDLVTDVVVFASRTPRERAEDIVELTRGICDRIGRWMAQPTDDKDMSTQSESFLSLFYMHPLPMWVCEPDSLRIMEVNDVALTVTGYGRDEIQNSRFLESLVVEDDAAALSERLGSSRQPRGLGTVTLRSRQGGRQVMYLRMFPLPWHDREALVLLGVTSPDTVPWLTQPASSSTGELTRRLSLLSPREKQVLEHVMTGATNKAIAAALQISPRTVEVYRASMMRKMEAHSLTHLFSLLTFRQY